MSSSDDDPDPGPSTVDTGEFFFPGADVSALLLHGLTGSPYEMRFLGECLAAAGARVCGVKLAGHGGAPEELGATTHRHWYESAIGGLERLREFGDPIVAIGQSAGAVLAARLAIEQREAVAGLAMLAPAFFLNFWTWTALRLIRGLRPIAGRIYLRSSGPDLRDAAARQIHPCTRLMPLGAALELYQMSASVRPRLGRVTQPALVVHSRQDHVCPLRNADFVMAHLGSAQKRLLVLEQSFHVVSVDVEKQLIADQVVTFVTRLRANQKAARALG